MIDCLIDRLSECVIDLKTPVTNMIPHQLAQTMANVPQFTDCLHKGLHGNNTTKAKYNESVNLSLIDRTA